MRRQAEALSASAQALEQAAELMLVQTEMFERTVRTVREPAEIAKGIARVDRRRRRSPWRRRRAAIAVAPAMSAPLTHRLGLRTSGRSWKDIGM